MGSMSSEIDVNLKRGKKRPVSPFYPSTTRYWKEDDMSELKDFFKSFEKKKPPDEFCVPRLEPPDALQVKIVHPDCFEGKDAALSPVPEKTRSLISTLKFKPYQQFQGETKVRKKEVLSPSDNSFEAVFSQPDSMASTNIPNMWKLEEGQSCDLKGFKVKASSKKVVIPEDDANVMVTSSPTMPDFDLLGMDCDMNNEPPAQNPTYKAGGKTCRRRGSMKSKSLMK